MRVTEYFRLDRTQAEVDFVDVDVYGDLRLFVDPHALRMLPTAWGAQCVELIQDYFTAVLALIQAGNALRAQEMLGVLKEPNETRLGLSVGQPRGKCLGDESAVDVYDALAGSEAVHSGLLEDLEDTVLMVPGIHHDKLSDIATNIIRGPLIAYTQERCRLYGIGLREGVRSGPVWDGNRHQWVSLDVSLPLVEGNGVSEPRLLLVPKDIVRRRSEYDIDSYYRKYLLADMVQEEESNPNSEFVHLLQDKRPKVYKKDLIDHYGAGKNVVVSLTRTHPDALARYRRDMKASESVPLYNDEIARTAGISEDSLQQRLSTMRAIPPGQKGATVYASAAEKLLTALFYPCLIRPGFTFNELGSSADVIYENRGVEGFFSWVASEYPRTPVVVRATNADGDPSDAALIELADKLVSEGGRVGLLVCRSITDRPGVAARCRKLRDSDGVLIVAIDDSNLSDMVSSVMENEGHRYFALLRSMADGLLS